MPVALIAWLVDLLLPPRCVSCGGPSHTLCPGCRKRLRRLRPPLCARCGAPTAWPVGRCRECAGRRLSFASARSAVEYEGPARALVHGWKERGLRHLSVCAAELVVEHIDRPLVDVITSVPADAVRQLRRGEHPAESLARELAARWALDLVSVLDRSRATERQAALPAARRRANVRRAFTAERPLSGARVLLVDDVYTTGSTVDAAASALRRHGARAVDVVTLARALRR